FKGGLTYLHERGYELYDLPNGTRIYNHESSEELLKQTALNLASQFNKDKGNNIEVTQNIYSPTPTPSEVARQTKNMLRELILT
ncbi:MAG: hypothetical protein E6649_16940, partial [Paeniclostridium sordellii]|nr:hypothetical protein [Paeniclostridium sordellii]